MQWMLGGRTRRVCDSCYHLLSSENEAAGQTAARSLSPGSMRSQTPGQNDETDDDAVDAQLAECPKCGLSFRGWTPDNIDAHIGTCFTSDVSKSPMAMGGRYLVHRLAQEAASEAKECPICFEEFAAGQEIATLTCLCQYHKSCIDLWRQRGKKGCPVHSTL
eukprot:Unigene11317_Nuclearia_a/m.34576 Unigene11317_Nuclearia_a/g.34576  ORF Unigene11317_Nuclearia_a/g.34576 Unigene11317_Nuclearia_a/m.34576 type:complete len:162 (-) Unigene11317_Nuclearia_a:29-514(-)